MAAKMLCGTVPMALTKLGYTSPEIDAIIHYIDEHEMIEGAPFLKDEHLPVFDCAFKPARGERSIQYMGHIRMMGATQPFISGAISKTVNVPREATVEDIERAYIESWRLGAKAISIYRDGSKRTQPLNTSRAGVADTRNVGGRVAVGQACTQAPQDTHSESMNSTSPGEIVDAKPRPFTVSANVPCVSSHALTQREQTMHFEGSKVKYGFDSSLGASRWFAPS